MRILATACFAFAAGILAAQYLLPTWLLPYAAFGCAALGVLWAWSLRDNARRRALLIGLGLAAALAWNGGYVRFVQAPFEAMTGEKLTLVMEAADYPSATDYGCRVEVRILARGLHGRAIYYGGEALMDIEPGMRLTAPVYVNSAATIRGSEVTTHTARGVFLLLYDRGAASVERGAAGSARYLPQRLARRVQGIIAAAFPERTRAFMNAILLGDKFDLAAEDQVALSEAGLYHVTAVSGLHCAFLVAILAFFIGRDHAKLLSAAAIPTLALYALTVGLTPSVVRACIMLTFMLLAPIFDRDSDPPTSLSVALALILLKNPFAVRSVSLQLSFAAMAGMIVVSERLYQAISRRKLGKLGHFLLVPLATTAGALAFTVPLSALYFGNLVLVAALSNLLCLWAASLTFAFGLLAVLAGFVFAPAAPFFALAPHAGALYLLGMARLLASVPYHAVYFANPYLKLWLVYVYAMLAACALLRGRFRYPAAGVLAIATLALTLWLNVRPFRDGALHMVALDVGQGQSVVLYDDGAAALLDCGSSSYLDAGDAAADYLQSVGVRALDYVVISHYHDDHCDGLPTLLARVRVDRLILPDIEPEDALRAEVLSLAERYDIPVTFVREDTSLPLGGASVTVYPPLSGGEMNEECLTALCSAGTFDALFTADIDAETEALLLAAHDLPDVEVMMAGHHGSGYSNGEDLLAAVTPELAVVSSGADNRYGHPNAEALRRIAAAGAAICRTDLQGNIHITVNNEE